MSFEAVLWATNDAPIANVNEFAVLMMLAEKADPDGCNAFPSRPTIAARTTVDPKTVLRALQSMETRGLIAQGDQRAAEYIRADRRPIVYDLLIPYSWFPNVERINKEREQRGRPPLTGSTRPDIAAAPPRVKRSDKGKPRSKSKVADQQESSRGDYQSPRDSDGYGVTLSPSRGDSQSGTGGLPVTQTSPVTPSTTSLSGHSRPVSDGSELGEAREREAAAPEGGSVGGGRTGAATPAGDAGGVPGPGGDADGSGDVVVMLTGLPGAVTEGAARRLVPLVRAAVAAGWTLAGLRAHLVKLCDPEKVRYAPAVYEKHLRELPAAPAVRPARAAGAGYEVGAGMCRRHLGHRADDCTPCDEEARGGDPAALRAEALAVVARMRASLSGGGRR
ncbi:helix-turn-helix domain-containing protein [Streptomyces nitrosporeus]|uniref:helix-turn-helix domain-containing protein n=2 Tax=Streptomyces nitrosporeus TaxID=28894 RepID=UPI00167D8C41|nr:helix-turn-helix domain-containing protein [Streptomyces nitrosporeus]GGZ29757.1 hypothetical protein GCM10010327_70020 [Streptomyces nitrosporeus]